MRIFLSWRGDTKIYATSAALVVAAAALFLIPKTSYAMGYVQSTLVSTYATTTTGSVSATFSSAPTAGDLVIVSLSEYRADGNTYKLAPSVTDNQGNTYKQAAMQLWPTNSSGPDALYVYYATNVTSGGGSFTVTATFAGNGDQVIIALEEVAGVSAMDQVTAASINSPVRFYNSITTPTLTSYYASEFFFAAQEHVNAVTTTVSSPFTQRQDFETATGGSQSLSIADMVSGPTSTGVTFNFNQTDNSSEGAILVLFKPTGVIQGHLDSTTFDTGAPNGTQLNSMFWQGTVPSGTSVQFQLAVSNSSSGPWSFIGPDGTSGTYFSGNPGGSINLVSTLSSLGYTLFNGYRYFRYRVQLTSDTTGTVTPTVTQVIVNWSP